MGISLKSFAFWKTKDKEFAKLQPKMDAITEKLSAEDITNLEEIIEWIVEEKIVQNDFDNSPDA